MKLNECSGVICVTHISKLSKTGDYRFSISVSTSAGKINSAGWIWNRGSHGVKAPANITADKAVRAQIRRLVTNHIVMNHEGAGC